jgi:hypothetical protein
MAGSIDTVSYWGMPEALPLLPPFFGEASMMSVVPIQGIKAIIAHTPKFIGVYVLEGHEYHLKAQVNLPTC